MPFRGLRGIGVAGRSCAGLIVPEVLRALAGSGRALVGSCSLVNSGWSLGYFANMSLHLNVGICPILWVMGGTLGTQGIAF